MKYGTKLLVIPGGCTFILQPLNISINKPFKSFIRHCWSERMVREAETGVARISPVSKSEPLEWIKTAADLIEQNPNTIVKSFHVTGIVENCTRNDVLYHDIQSVRKLFGQKHMGYVEPTEDPFTDSDSSTQSSDDEAASVFSQAPEPSCQPQV